MLSQRNLESVLLCDEILEKLCKEYKAPEKTKILMNARDDKLKGNEANGIDDFKPVAQEVHHKARYELTMKQPGETKEAFMRDILAPLVTSKTEIYGLLKHDVFGDSDT